MSGDDAALERRCARLARAYPDPRRAAEVAATLADANAGRRAPRAADAVDVLWHGLRARLGSTAAGTRFGVWGDAAAVAVVQAVVMQAVVAAVLAVGAFERPATEYPRHPYYPSYRDGGPVFFTRAEAYLALAAALLAVVTAVAACRGRVLAARLGVLGGAAGVLAAVVASRSGGNEHVFTTPAALAVAVAGLCVTAAVAGTRAVARAARVVPGRWWWAGAGLCAAVAADAVLLAPTLGSGRADLVVASYVFQALVLFVVAAPFARRRPAVAGGAALVALAAGGLAAGVVNWSHVPDRLARTSGRCPSWAWRC